MHFESRYLSVPPVDSPVNSGSAIDLRLRQCRSFYVQFLLEFKDLNMLCDVLEFPLALL